MHQRTLAFPSFLLAFAAVATAQQQGPSSSEPAFILPTAAGVVTRSLLTVGDSVNGYRLAGIQDGMGGFRTPGPRADAGFRLVSNHEFGASSGIARTHGGTGSWVSEWRIDPITGVVERGSDLIRRILLWDKNTASYQVGNAVAMERLCSGDLAHPTAFAYHNRGTGARIFLSGEETRPPFSPDHGRAFAHVVTGPEAGTTYELPALGRVAFENVVACPYPQNKTIVVGLDDADRQVDPMRTPAPSELYVYVGRKQRNGNEVERAGLTGGSLYGVQVRVGGNVASQESNDFGFGTLSYVGSADFAMHDFGDVTQWDGLQLQAAAIANDVTRFQRIEDGVWDPRLDQENCFYFVTTGNIGSLKSRLFKLTFRDISRPERGGRIEILLEGTEGQEMLDNLTIDRKGNLLLQEDVGGNARLGRIWQYDTTTGALTEVAAHSPEYFAAGGAKFMTTDEESSGIFDASSLMGPGWFLLDVQAHTDAGDVELGEKGQLLALYNPASARDYGDINNDGRRNFRDLLDFLGAWRDGLWVSDFDGDGVQSIEDALLFLYYSR